MGSDWDTHATVERGVGDDDNNANARCGHGDTKLKLMLWTVKHELNGV